MTSNFVEQFGFNEEDFAEPEEAIGLYKYLDFAIYIRIWLQIIYSRSRLINIFMQPINIHNASLSLTWSNLPSRVF